MSLIAENQSLYTFYPPTQPARHTVLYKPTINQVRIWHINGYSNHFVTCVCWCVCMWVCMLAQWNEIPWLELFETWHSSSAVLNTMSKTIGFGFKRSKVKDTGSSFWTYVNVCLLASTTDSIKCPCSVFVKRHFNQYIYNNNNNNNNMTTRSYLWNECTYKVLISWTNALRAVACGWKIMPECVECHRILLPVKNSPPLTQRVIK